MLKHFKAIKGYSVVEVIVAASFFMIVLAGIVPFYLSVIKTNIKDSDRLQAEMYLQQGLEAARAIRDRGFTNLTNGTYGLSRSNGYWVFVPNVDVLGKFSRQIIISDLQRDSSCNIVSSGGTTDPYSKQINVIVSWSDGGAMQQMSKAQYLTNWASSVGCEQAGNFLIDLSGIGLSSGGQRVTGVKIRNAGNTPITIDRITATWNNGRLIEEIKIASTIVWKYNNTGTPQGQQPSGTELNIVDYVIPAQSGWLDLDHFFFNGNMSGATFTIYFRMADGTIKYQQANL